MTTATTFRTLGDIRDNGYKLSVSDETFQRGYISRKIDPALSNNTPVHVAKGKRAGRLYYLAPCFSSSQYCVRRYFYVFDSDGKLVA